MITFRTSTEITADRSIMLALPPETPLGKAELTVTIASHDSTDKSVGDLRSLFGTGHSGDSRAADNDRIDADLARAYERSDD